MTTTTHFDQLRLAERWGLSTATLERWRTSGTGPKCIRLPGKVIYQRCDIAAHENECLVSSTAEFRKHTKPSDQPESPRVSRGSLVKVKRPFRTAL